MNVRDELSQYAHESAVVDIDAKASGDFGDSGANPRYRVETEQCCCSDAHWDSVVRLDEVGDLLHECWLEHEHARFRLCVACGEDWKVRLSQTAGQLLFVTL